MNAPDGGPAFPGFNYVSSNVHDGMPLRDYFAARALNDLIAHWVSGRTATDIAALAYEYADAMLKERAK